MNVHFHTEDDQYVPPIRRFQHRIAVYPTARQEVLLAWHRTQTDAASRKEAERFQKALVEHWLTVADNCRREFRFLAAIGALREALRLDPAPTIKEKLHVAVALQAKLDADLVEALHQIDERRFPQAIEGLQKILAVKPDLAIAHGKLGTAYAVAGKPDLAVEHLQAVAKYDSDDPYGFMMLGWLAYLKGKSEDAVAAYRRADAIEPFNAKTHYHWGLALAKLDRWAEAEECYRRLLTIDPKHAGGYQALSHALREQGKFAEAVRCARRAALLTRFENADILVTLTEAYAAADRIAEAQNAARKALDAAQAGNPALVPHIRERLEDILARSKQAPKK
jgi:tetratricopeptide (TPR) repeat protein